MDSMKNERTSFPKHLEQYPATQYPATQYPAVLSTEEQHIVDDLAMLITPSSETVADWHYIDAKMYVECERPLMRVLRFFVEGCLGSMKIKRVIDIRDPLPEGIAA